MTPKDTGKLFIAQSVLDAAYHSFSHGKTAVLWSGGKDSTALLHMIRERYGKIPFRVVYGNLNFEDRELSGFIQRISRMWSFKVIREEILSKKEARFFQKTGEERLMMSLVDARYSQSLKTLSSRLGIQAYILGNRSLENKKNTAFVKKTRGTTSYYPLLQMNDLDVWDYVYRHHVPFLKTYLKGVRRTSALMFIHKPTFGNHLASLVMHLWLKARSLLPKSV